MPPSPQTPWTPATAPKCHHAPHAPRLEEQFLRKDLLVCPRNESDPGHMLSWWLIIKRWLKVFGSPSRKSDEKEKKKKKTRKVIAKLFALNANTKRCLNVKFSTYYFHMKTKILAELQICIGVPLISEYAFSLHVELKFSFLKKTIRGSMKLIA